MFKFISIISLAAFAVQAQTPTVPQVPAGLLYQAAVMAGLQPISPISGQAIINEKAALNWKTVAGQVLADGSIGVLTAGLSGIISLGKVAEVSLAASHAFYDHSVAPLLAAAAPNPNDIPPVLQVTGTVAPSAGACVEASMFITPNKAAHSVAPVNVGGLTVSFAIQSPQVLKNASGSVIKKFAVVDVIACPPINGSMNVPTAITPADVNVNKHTYFVDPDGQLDHLARARKLYFAGEDYPESVRQYNAAMKEHPEDRDGILNEMTGSLYHDGPMGVALADVINNHYSQEGVR